MTNKNENTSRSSSGSGEREAANPHVMECNYRLGPIGAPGCICRVVNRALSSGERVRALEEALSDLVRFQPEEGRANRSHYAEHGMLCLAAYDGTGACDCGWTEWKAAEDLARCALSAPVSGPGDATNSSKEGA